MLSLGFISQPHRDFEPRTATGTQVLLAPGQVWSADPGLKPGPGRDLELTVASGEVWVTQSGDRVDHILHAGERLRLARHGRIVIQATAPTVLRIDRTIVLPPAAA